MKWIEFVPYTKVYDVDLGPMSVSDLYEKKGGKIKVYNEWGGIGEGTITRIDKKQDVYFSPTPEITHVSANYYENGARPANNFALRPSKKWFIQDVDNERNRRNKLAEHFEMSEHGEPQLVFEPSEMGDMLKIREYLPFYGVSVTTKHDTAILEVDKNRASCFFVKALPYQEDTLAETIQYWREGGWFRTLEPITDKYVDKVLEHGIFFEGYKGYPDYLPFVILDTPIDRQLHTFYRVDWPSDMRLDLGHYML